jgi:alkylhydroperoxidase family enzyme
VTWLPEQATGASEFERVFGLRTNLFAAWREFVSLLWEKRLAPPVILQLAQLRVRRLHRLALGAHRMSEAREAGWDESRVAELDAWWKSPRFDAAERACLGLAEQFVLDAKGISDEEIAPVRAALGDAAVVAFVEALAIFDGFTRFQKMLGIASADAPSPPSKRREARALKQPGMRIALPIPLGADPIQASALAHQPEALASFMKLYGTLWSRGLLSHGVKEMARIRSARTVDCGF